MEAAGEAPGGRTPLGRAGRAEGMVEGVNGFDELGAGGVVEASAVGA